MCDLCHESEATRSVWLDGDKKICHDCVIAIIGEDNPPTGNAERLMEKIRKKINKLNLKLKNDLKKMSDREVILEHQEITKRPLNESDFEYLDEINKEMTLRGIKDDDLYKDFNQILYEDYENYVKNNKVSEYDFDEYRRDVLKAREELIHLQNKICEI